MDKIAVYKEYIYKIATQAWKKNLDNLSDAAKQRLIDAGIWNYRKEIDGSVEGSHNIAQKKNITIGNMTKGQVIDDILAQKSMEAQRQARYKFPWLSKQFDRAAARILLTGSPAYFTYLKDGGEAVANMGNPDEFIRMIRLLKMDPTPNVPWTKEEKDALHALAKRHEVYEAESLLQAKKQGKLWQGQILKDQLTTRMASHAHPNIPIKDMSTAAVFPERVRKVMEKMRAKEFEGLDLPLTPLIFKKQDGDRYATALDLRLGALPPGQDIGKAVKSRKATRFGDRLARTIQLDSIPSLVKQDNRLAESLKKNQAFRASMKKNLPLAGAALAGAGLLSIPLIRKYRAHKSNRKEKF